MKIGELMSGIRNQDLVLPEFQREYRWSKERAKQLMVSLFKEHPVGGILLWKTSNPPDLKNIKRVPEKLGTYSVILDGQQRLTTLYMLLTGAIPPYYKESEIQTDPRDLHFNLQTGEFQYYLPSLMKKDVRWVRVVECFSDEGVDVVEIADQVSQETAKPFKEVLRVLAENHKRLLAIPNAELPEQIVPDHVTIEEAIDIFDKMNSQGTKLTDAELALTHVTGKWPHARRVLKKKIDKLSGEGFRFDLTFMTRALAVVTTQRALFPQLHGQPAWKLKEAWQKLDGYLDYVVSLLPSAAFIHGTSDLNSPNVLIPLIAYLDRVGGHFPDDSSVKNAVHWLYAAHIWSRYTALTDQRLERDVSIVVQTDDSPWDELRDQIVDQRGRIEVKAADLEGHGTPHPLYRMLFILTKAHGGIDWFNGLPLAAKTVGKAFSIHSHHIFPQSLLYKELYDPDNHLHRKLVNEIANRAFLTADTNLAMAAKPPEEYLVEVEEKFPGALVSQFIPMDRELWKVQHYEDFLEARRQLIATKINDYMKSLIEEPVVRHKVSARRLIPLGESSTLEFKSTLQWDMVHQRVNKDLRYSVLKTIAAFLNTQGGTLLIGVEDNGEICGLDYDLKVVNKHNTDGFQMLLMQLVSEKIGPHAGAFVHPRFEEVDGKLVCVVDIDKASEPVFLKTAKGKEFFVRLGSMTKSLDPEETVQFISANW